MLVFYVVGCIGEWGRYICAVSAIRRCSRDTTARSSRAAWCATWLNAWHS